MPEKPANHVKDAFCISTMEFKLYNLINSYRQRYDLPPIPLSKSLCFVASTHVKDLYYHHPDKGSCNAHSWSNQGNWRPFCYPKDETKYNSVWDKPRELTPYKGKGIEIVYYENDAVVIDSIIALWKSMDYFNSFLTNTGKWQGKKWNAIGIGIHENYACAWFGEMPDPDGEPVICGQEPPKTVTPPKEEPVGKNEPENKVIKKSLQEQTTKENPAGPELTTPAPVQGKEHFYIIVKGVAPEKELHQVLNDIRAKGYSTSRLIESNGKQRVSIMEFADRTKADSAIRQLRKYWPEAWILKQ